MALGQVGQSCGVTQERGITPEKRQHLSQAPAGLARSIPLGTFPPVVLFSYSPRLFAVEFEKTQPISITDAAKRKKKKRTRATDSCTGTFDGNIRILDLGTVFLYIYFRL